MAASSISPAPPTENISTFNDFVTMKYILESRHFDELTGSLVISESNLKYVGEYNQESVQYSNP